MDEQYGTLTDLVFSLVERLMLSSAWRREQIIDLISPIQADLEAMRGEYQAPCPEGAEEVRSLMDEMLGLYQESLQRIEAFMDSRDEELLKGALTLAQDAGDLLTTVEGVVQNNLDMLSEVSQA